MANEAKQFTIGGVTHDVMDEGARQLISSLTSRIDTLIGSGNVQGAIDTFNEITAFLNGIDTSDPTLRNQLLALNNAITTLQSTLANKANAADVYDKQTVDDMVDDAGKVKSVTINGQKKTPNEETGDVDLGEVQGDSGITPHIDVVTGHWFIGDEDTGIDAHGLQGNSGYTGAVGELEVVNNLTDGGATKALSAEQGKLLHESIPVADLSILGKGEWVGDTFDLPQYQKWMRNMLIIPQQQLPIRSIRAIRIGGTDDTSTTMNIVAVRRVGSVATILRWSQMTYSSENDAFIVDDGEFTLNGDEQYGFWSSSQKFGFNNNNTLAKDYYVTINTLAVGDVTMNLHTKQVTRYSLLNYSIVSELKELRRTVDSNKEIAEVSIHDVGIYRREMSSVEITSKKGAPWGKNVWNNTNIYRTEVNVASNGGRYIIVDGNVDLLQCYGSIKNAMPSFENGDDVSQYIISTVNYISGRVAVKLDPMCQLVLLVHRSAQATDVINYVYAPTTDDSISDLPRILASPTAYERNRDKEKYLFPQARIRNSGGRRMDMQFLIVTDIHEEERLTKNALNLADNFDTISAILNCGDTCSQFDDFASTYASITEMSGKPVYTVIGNHDAGNSVSVHRCADNKMMYNAFIKPMVDRGHLVSGEYTENKCYWYHDFTYKDITANANRTMRLIGINDFDFLDDEANDFVQTHWMPISYDSELDTMLNGKSYDVGEQVNIEGYEQFSFECVTACTTPSITLDGNAPKYKYSRGSRVISESQANWLCQTLLSTPANSSIVLMMHMKIKDSWEVQTDKKFCASSNIYANASSYMNTDVVEEIIQAFVNGATLNLNVTFKSNYPKSGYQLQADFSSKNTGIVVAGLLCGHSHQDLIYKSGNLWQISPTCTGTTAAHGPITHGVVKNGNITEDCLTVVTFQPYNYKIHLCKLGATMLDDMSYEMDYEVINTTES